MWQTTQALYTWHPTSSFCLDLMSIRFLRRSWYAHSSTLSLSSFQGPGKTALTAFNSRNKGWRMW